MLTELQARAVQEGLLNIVCTHLKATCDPRMKLQSSSLVPGAASLHAASCLHVWWSRG